MGMKVTEFGDPEAYRDRVEPYLLRDEPRHNLMLGLIRTFLMQPEAYSERFLWLVEDGDRVAGAALMTPP